MLELKTHWHMALFIGMLFVIFDNKKIRCDIKNSGFLNGYNKIIAFILSVYS